MDKLIEAVGRLVKAKGRYHTEQNYKAVVEAYDEAIAERATEAGTPAKAVTWNVGEISRAIENAYVAHTGEHMDAGVAWDCAKAAKELAEQHASARAEEARREADLKARDDVARALSLLPGVGADGRYSFAWSFLLEQIEACVKVCDDVAAQRTAGWDAAELMKVAEACVSQGCTIAMEDHFEAKGMPVEEAAAQADGTELPIRTWQQRREETYARCAPHAGDVQACMEDEIADLRAALAARLKPSVELVECGTCGCQVSLPVGYVLDRAAPAAQPTRTVVDEYGNETRIWAAQPTPSTEYVTRESALEALEHVEQHNGPGRKAEAVAMLEAAQPTLPDDERAANIKTWRKRAEDGTDEALTASQCLKLADAEIADLRAALRQPGALPDDAEDAARWAAERWTAEVANRPLANVHRRTLDDTWRQVIRHFGGDPDALIGPSHDALLALAAKQAGEEV